jgi:hypothetical protein
MSNRTRMNDFSKKKKVEHIEGLSNDKRGKIILFSLFLVSIDILGLV